MGIRNYISRGKKPAIDSSSLRNRWAHVIVVVPDGRILLHRNVYSSGKIGSPWCATINTSILSTDRLRDKVSLRLRTLFDLDLKNRELKHILSHAIAHRNMQLEVHRLKLFSMTKLYCSHKTEVRSIPFIDLIREIRKRENDFTETTKLAYNILSKTQAVGDN